MDEQDMEKSKIQYAWSDAWLLCSIVIVAGDNAATLVNIIAAGDWRNHAIFTTRQLRGGLARLSAGGFITENEEGFVPSEIAKKEGRRVEDYEILLGSRKKNPDAINRKWCYPGITEETVGEAYQEYLKMIKGAKND
ncbi:MAG: hypothetical protein K9K86_08210 [Pseudomonadales bacterium]|nr:hypothetical protein [Pseudomonadales bacterium]